MSLDINQFISMLPVPATLFEITWTLIGVQFGNTFSKVGNNGGMDEYIKEHGKFKGFAKYIVENTLNFLHHWEIGLILIIYPMPYMEIKWFGLGLLIDDGLYEFYKPIKKLRERLSTKPVS